MNTSDGDELLDEFTYHWRECPACGRERPESCGFHPYPQECMCYGSLCTDCLDEALS